MDNIKNIVHDVIGKISLQQNNPQNQLENSWKNIISEKEQKHIRLDGYKNGVLMTFVDSPAWMYEFKKKKNKILIALQKDIPEITNILFKIGKVQ